MSETLRLEGFDTDLRGHRFLVVGEATSWLKHISTLESQALYKGRSILIIQENQAIRGASSVNPLLLRKRWDMVFRIKDQFEAQMLATYVANAPKPMRILWVSASGTNSEIPRGLWQKWVKMSDTTLIGGSDTGVLGCEWEAVLFPQHCGHEIVERILGSRATRVKEHLTEIGENGAALAWTNIEERDSRGSLFWYDPNENTTQMDLFTKKEAAALLEGLADWIGGEK